MADRSWLDDFVEHTKYGEAPPNIMRWVGISTIAGALRRKVWIDERAFQWTPNFYILLIGPPGILKKSTSISLGMRMLRRLEGINFGPDNITWEQLVAKMADVSEVGKINEKEYRSSNLTLDIGEFDTFFDPANRSLVAQLTRLYDAPATFSKETKTNGCDYIENPWLNMCACTTPEWMDEHFSTRFIGSGFASRINYIYCMETGRVSHPSQRMPSGGYWEDENRLVTRLMEISELSGEFKLTKEAYAWSDDWYNRFRDFLEKECDKSKIGLYSRGQTHLMKLAMVISASRGDFPRIDVEHLEEADRMLQEIGLSIPTVFDRVGQGSVSKLAGEVLDRLVKEGSMTKKELYKRYFFKKVSSGEFDEALKSVKASGMVKEGGDMTNPVLEVV